MAGTLSRLKPANERRLEDFGTASAASTAGLRLARPIVVVHALTLAAAFGAWAYLDRNLWFFGDEWDFLTRRGLHGAYFSIWAPHNEHWSLLPILLWRAAYSLEHLSSYWPYLVPLLLAHVLVVHLLWRRCLREGADPWVATALALLFALLGAGAEDLAWAFQVGFVSSVLFGLLSMEVVEGPPSAMDAPFPLPAFQGPVIWRDAVASLLALAALMCSTVGVATGVALGVLLLGRFGWQRALRVLAMPAGVFLVWFALAGRSGLKATGDYLGLSVLSKIPTFVATNLAADVGKTAGWARGGHVLAIAMLAWLFWRTWGTGGLFRRHPAVLGGAIAAVVFYSLAALGRDRISATEAPSRYAYVGIAFMLPTFALVLSALRNLVARKRTGLAPGQAREATAGSVAGARSGASAGAVAAGGGSAMVGRLWPYLRLVVVAVVLLATLSNTLAGIRFARTRTVYVRGLENQIITSAALLQSSAQMAKAVDRYPIWASGNASGYLTPEMLASLYRARLLPMPSRALITPAEILNDETWLDITDKHHLFHHAFHLLSTFGVRWYPVPPRPLSGVGVRDHALAASAELGWPRGPGVCEWAVTTASILHRAFPSSLRFSLAPGSSSGSLWLSLGRAGGKVLASLAAPWGTEGLPGPVALEGEALQLGSGRQVWVNDSAGRDDLVLQLTAGSVAEFCGLAEPARVS
ncbi:MAG TPA: hypothetical protein VMS00_03265 [Acidimicrobiales bacterium]|nr:hypothetical protein [Acidimicrobiales bacterium]